MGEVVNSTFRSRAGNKQVAPEQAAVKAEEPADETHVCGECGFEAKTAGGLASHQRKHEDGDS